MRSNGADFVAGLQSRLPGVPIRILSGQQEAEFSAMGVLCGIPAADGILADIGGGSLELVRLDRGARGVSHTLSLGAIRLAERAGGDLVRARAIAEADLATVPWLAEGADRDLYLVGGAWRALARIHMAQTGYPLQMVHHYTISREEARDLTGVIAGAGRRALERLPGAVAPPASTICRSPRWCCAACCVRPACAAWCSAPAGCARAGSCSACPRRSAREDPLLAAGTSTGRTLGRDPGAAAGAARLDRSAVPGRDRRGAAAARGGMLDVRHRQPRPSGVPRRAGVPAGAAPAWRSGWTTMRGRSSRW